MKPYTLTLSESHIKKLEQTYKGFEKRTDIAHTLFQIKGLDFTITAYKSGKVVFQGEGAAFHAAKFGAITDAPTQTKAKTVSPTGAMNTDPMGGSDEVGTGDYFGPVIVCAVLTDTKALDHLPLDAIMDSKQMNDETIRRIAPTLKKHLAHSILVLDNRKYNKVHEVHNLNTIKALLHNQAYLNLAKNHPMPQVSVVDQFMPEAAYYRALANQPNVYNALRFATKAENQYLAVACASILARAAFLDYFDKLNEKYDFTFPKGAGNHVDEAGVEFVKRYGVDALSDVAKTHFINTSRILNAS